MSSKSGGKETEDISNEIKENVSKTTVKSDKKSTYFILIGIFIIIIAIFIKFLNPSSNLNEEDLLKRGGVIIENEVYKVFELYDRNKDGYLEPTEFQPAFYHIKTNQISKTSENAFLMHSHQDVSSVFLL